MRGNILKRLKIVEHEIETKGKIPDNEKIVAIVCPNGDTEQFERLRNEKLDKLREQYGALPDDLLVIWIRQFFSKADRGCV